MPKQVFYAVKTGRKAGIYPTWPECEEQIKHYPGAVYKKFPSVAEADAFVQGIALPQNIDELPGTGGEPRGQKRTLAGIKTVNESEWNVVYSDGACKGNGQFGSVAGVGVYWGPNDSRNIAERCPGEQTNNRAELIAIIRVLETAPVNKKKLLIKTDSQYSINCFERWLPKWRENGFRTANGSEVKNIGIIRYLSALLEGRAARGQQVRLQYVKGHSGDVGNNGADAQANIGATFPPQPDRDWEILETRAKEVTDGLLEASSPVQVREVDENNESSPDRPVKMLRISSPQNPQVGSTTPCHTPIRSNVKRRPPGPVSDSPVRPPRSAVRPSTSSSRPTIYQKGISESADIPYTSMFESATPPNDTTEHVQPNTSLQIQGEETAENLLAHPQNSSKNDSQSEEGGLKVSAALPPLVPVPADEIDLDVYKDCLLEGDEWEKEIGDL